MEAAVASFAHRARREPLVQAAIGVFFVACLYLILFRPVHRDGTGALPSNAWRFQTSQPLPLTSVFRAQ